MDAPTQQPMNDPGSWGGFCQTELFDSSLDYHTKRWGAGWMHAGFGNHLEF